MTDTRSALKIRKDVIAMMNEHTPGPWNIAISFAEHGLTMNDGGVPVMGDGGNKRVCVVDLQADVPKNARYGSEDKVRDANARLIAAALKTAAERDRLKALNAELVEALEEITADLEESYNDGNGARPTSISAAIHRARTAIVKSVKCTQNHA